MKHDHNREVIGRIARGDESALVELYRRHAQVLFNFAARMLPSADDASEAVSDLFLSTWSGAAGLPCDGVPADSALVSRLREMLLRRSREGTAGRPAREVDLWALVSLGGPGSGDAGGAKSGPDGPRSTAALRAILDRCGAVSTSVLSLVYFGGYAVPEVAARFSMTPAECRTRLHGCLELLASGKVERRKDRPHHGRYAVCSGAWVLGAVTREEEPGYFDHLGNGCPECTEELARFTVAAHRLPSLLPAVNLPPELLDKILFSLRLAQIAGSVPRPAEQGQSTLPAAGASPAAAEDEPEPGPPPWRPEGTRAVAMLGLGVAVTVLIAILAIRDLGHRRELEAQSELIETLQARHTDLMLKYDRLAGISGYFEAKGVETVLEGTGDYPGLTGRIVWDTSGGSAMLQILNPPDGLELGRLRVRAVGDDAALRVAEFHGDGRDSGDVLYRFFPMDVVPDIRHAGFTVDAPAGGRGDAGNYRVILSGEIPGRQ